MILSRIAQTMNREISCSYRKNGIVETVAESSIGISKHCDWVSGTVTLVNP